MTTGRASCSASNASPKRCAKTFQVGAGAEKLLAPAGHDDGVDVQIAIQLADERREFEQSLGSKGICRRIVQRHDGGMSVDLAFDHGDSLAISG
jgi:hypothetical protein